MSMRFRAARRWAMKNSPRLVNGFVLQALMLDAFRLKIRLFPEVFR